MRAGRARANRKMPEAARYRGRSPRTLRAHPRRAHRHGKREHLPQIPVRSGDGRRTFARHPRGGGTKNGARRRHSPTRRKKLAAAFGVTLKDAAEVYTLVKESGCMPEALISPPEQKRGFRAKLAFRVRRSAWRGYLFSGAFLLLFSLFTIFPVYYVVSGGVLLAIAAAVRFFGKKD